MSLAHKAPEVFGRLVVEKRRTRLSDLKEFPRFFPRHATSRVYGAVAGLSFVENSDKYAHRRGLFVLGVVGEGIVQVRNPANFRPKDFGPRKARKDL